MISYELRQQHDLYGNAPNLLSDDNKAKIEAGLIRRVGGDAICSVCGKIFYKHEPVLGALWLNQGCEDFLLKL